MKKWMRDSGRNFSRNLVPSVDIKEENPMIIQMNDRSQQSIEQSNSTSMWLHQDAPAMQQSYVSKSAMNVYVSLRKDSTSRDKATSPKGDTKGLISF